MNFRKKILKKIVSLILCLTLSFSIVSIVSPSVGAYATFSGSKMINGVGQSGNRTRYYWYDTSSLDSAWLTRISNAVTAWSNTGTQGCGVYTSVWMKRTTTKSSSVIDFYNGSIGNCIVGITSFYTGTGSNSVQIHPDKSPQDWVWAKIILDTQLSDLGILTATQKNVLPAHEIGHAFGLAHVTNTAVIMHKNADEWTASRPTSDDCRGVNYLYGGYNP